MACDGYVRILIVGEPDNEHYPKNLQSNFLYLRRMWSCQVPLSEIYTHVRCRD